VEGQIEWIKIQDMGDGSAKATLAETATLSMSFQGSRNRDIHVNLSVDMMDFVTLVSGSIQAMQVNMAGPNFVVRADEIKAGDKSVPATIKMTLKDVVSNYLIVSSADKSRKFSGDASTGLVTTVVNIKEPGGDGFFSLNSELTSIAASMLMILPEKFDPANVFKSGLSADIVYELGGSTMDVAFKAKKDRFAMTASAAGGHADISLSSKAFSMGIKQTDVEMNISASTIPLPSVSLAYDEMDFSIGVPLEKSDDPADVHLRTALRGLTVSETVWAMVDPMQVLPRDPATVAVDLAGKIIVLADLSDPESLAEMGGPPALPVSLDLTELTASIAGALLKGTGSVTFNMDNAPGGMPMPVGEVNLNLKGGFGLMDKLVELGLVPADASMGVRAMMGAFAKPVGDDELESKIEMTEDGHISANGQRLK